MIKKSIAIFALLFTILSCKNRENDWQDMLNYKDFSNWSTFVLKPEKKGVLEEEMVDTTAYLIPKVYLSDDPQTSVFKYETIENKKMLHLSGELLGFLTSKKTYENYHLKMKFKFGKKWKWLGDRPRDGGIFYHVINANTNKEKTPNEFNIHDGDIGSYWSFGGLGDIPSKLTTNLPQSIKVITPILKSGIPSLKDSMYVFDKNGEIRTFGESIPDKQICVVNPVSDNKCGEWNVLELVCLGDTVIHVVNGKVVMVIYHAKYKNDENKLVPLTKGSIKIQSEGGEQFIEYIKIRKINRIPDEFKNAIH
jgi:hypothetical protein